MQQPLALSGYDDDERMKITKLYRNVTSNFFMVIKLQ